MDPEEVRRFAEELKRFNGDLQNQLTSLQARFSSLSETWQDQENDKYSEEFKTTVKALKKFVESSRRSFRKRLTKACLCWMPRPGKTD